MTLKDAIQYRRTTVNKLAQNAQLPDTRVKWVMERTNPDTSVETLRRIAQALNGGVLITADGLEWELYGE